MERRTRLPVGGVGPQTRAAGVHAGGGRDGSLTRLRRAGAPPAIIKRPGHRLRTARLDHAIWFQGLRLYNGIRFRELRIFHGTLFRRLRIRCETRCRHPMPSRPLRGLFLRGRAAQACHERPYSERKGSNLPRRLVLLLYPSQPTHAASPTERIRQRIRFIGAIMVIGIPSVNSWAFEGVLVLLHPLARQPFGRN